MRRLQAAAGSGVFVRELAPAGPPQAAAAASGSRPAGAVDVELAASLWGDAELPKQASPTAKKLHRRLSPGAALKAALSAPSRQGRRAHLAAAAAAALLLLILWTGQKAASSPLLPPAGLSGTIKQQQQQQQQLQQQQKEAEEARQWLAQAALLSEVEQARQPVPGPVLVEFTAPGLLVPLKDALNVALPDQPLEAALWELLPPSDGATGGASSPAAAAGGAATGGRPTLDQVLQRYEQLGTGGRGSRDQAAAAGGGGGSRRAASLASDIEHKIQQAEEAAQRANKEAQEALLYQPEQQPAGGSEQAYHAAAAASLRRADDWLGQPAFGSAEASAAAAVGSGEVRMFVGVISACCSQLAFERRAVIRDTWGKTLRERHPGIHLRFFLAQPATTEAAAAWLPTIQEEVVRYNDTVVLRGMDTYRNLPNKTLRLMRYVLAHPAGYTHVLKTDDDCYVRMPKILEALQTPPEEAPASTLPPPHLLAGGGAVAAGGDGAAGPRVTGVRQGLREWMAQDVSHPLHTDGINVYNATALVASATAGGTADRKFLDDEEGHPVSLAQMAREAAAAAQQARQQQQEGQKAGGSTAAAAGGAGSQAQAGPGLALVGPGRPPRMKGVWLGCMENKGGFFPIRDPASKWYMSHEELSDSAVPFAVKYLAGWGVVLSRDLMQHAVAKANLYTLHPELAPPWFKPMHWEDVLTALLLMDAAQPQDHPGFRAAWRACPSTTALKHLDVDAPLLFRGLHEQDLSGLWAAKPVQCAIGDYLPGDYSGWKRWRDALPSVAHI